MSDPSLPTLYSFRRCPYAMRARLALTSAGTSVALREIVLRDKPDAFLATSPSGTVPCLKTPDSVIDESLDIMIWALKQHDPEGWLDMPQQGWTWIERADGPFKKALDHTKYASRYPDLDARAERAAAGAFLAELDAQIDHWIFERPSLADYAILPFVRQFAFVDKPWFDAQPWPNLQAWLERFLVSDRFQSIMHKYSKWQPGDATRAFP
ncbi:MAG: glutathione S-transferase [Thalassovita sp.]